MATLNLLLLEDNPLDAELVLGQLADAGLNCRATCVHTRADFRAALARGGLDLILSDYSLPGFDGAEALVTARSVCPDVPFIFVSGAIGEEAAIETLTGGATDYVLKHRLERLVPAVRRAVREAADRAERRRLENELRRRADELAEADRRKDNFLALLAHELRNPLAPVRNSLEILHRQGLPDPTSRHAWEIMDRQVENLSRLVDDLLDVSRITRDKIRLRRERVDLSAAVRMAVEAARPLIDRKRHRLATAYAPDPLWVDADRVRVEQVATNLITNAAKYTDPGGEVTVTTRAEGGEGVLSVRDTGIGIAPEAQPHVFEMFVQADHDPDRAQGGLGLGLTLVRRLVELHGGRVAVASEGLGRGSEFTARLPLLQAAEPPAETLREAPQAARPAAGQRVLVVDDNVDAAESLAMLLEMAGHQVRVAHDGPAAVAAARVHRPQLTVLDIGLPGMNGYEVARRLRADPATQGGTLVAVTGWGQQEDRRRSREAGFDHHRTKPVDPEEILRLLAPAAG